MERIGDVLQRVALEPKGFQWRPYDPEAAAARADDLDAILGHVLACERRAGQPWGWVR